jgi:hypothetical protein
MEDKDKYGNPGGEQGHLDENEIALFAEHLQDKTVGVPDRIVRHVASCPQCRAEVMAVSDLLGELPDLALEPEASYSVTQKGGSGSKLFTFRGLARTAAAIAAVFALSWIVQQVILNQRDQRKMAVNAGMDSTATDSSSQHDTLKGGRTGSGSDVPGKVVLKPDTVLYADAYVPEPTYESLVGARYRATGDPKVKGPGPGTVLAPGDTLLFTWMPRPDAWYRLLVVDNTGRTKMELDLPSSGRLALKADLKPGLYYWKFLGHEELWKVGKFKVMHK